jgi:hypothetical protein
MLLYTINWTDINKENYFQFQSATPVNRLAALQSGNHDLRLYKMLLFVNVIICDAFTTTVLLVLII